MKQEEKYSVDEMLQSLDGLQRAKANSLLFQKIERSLSVQVRGRIIPLRTVSAAAASVLLLLAINIFMLLQKHENVAPAKDSMQQLVHYYGFTDDYGI